MLPVSIHSAVVGRRLFNLALLPILLGFFERKASHIFNLETWALTNIAFETSDNTNVVIDREAILVFVKLLDPPSEDIREQVVGP